MKEIEQVDSQLAPFLAGLDSALQQQRAVVSLQLWKRLPSLSLLPFHLHLRWVNGLPALPLTIHVGLVPFRTFDNALVNRPLYVVNDVLSARETARRNRASLQTNLPNDFLIPDWEQGCREHQEELGESVLPGASFLRVDVVRPDGSIQKGHRSVLGQLAKRQHQLPYVLVPSQSGISPEAARAFTSLDLLIVNIQGMRGRRDIQSVKNVLRARGTNRATIIVASSPSDLLAVELDKMGTAMTLTAMGNTPNIRRVSFSSVGQERIQAERKFHFAVEELRGRSETTDYLIDLAKSAWWSIQQSLDDETLAEPEMKRFANTLERLAADAPEETDLLRSGQAVIAEAAQDENRKLERREAIAKVALYGSGNITIIGRGGGVKRLRKEIAQLVALPEESLSELGLRFQFGPSWVSDNSADTVIVAGYFGLATIDKILASRATHVHLVFDPIEARAAWFGTQKLMRCLRQFGVTEPIAALEKLANGIEECIPSHLRATTTDIAFSIPSFDFGGNISTNGHQRLDGREGSLEEVSIYFTDGTQIEAAPHTRFDFLAAMGGQLKSKTAESLQPGDEVVILQEDTQALFSEQLIQTLDRGRLKDAAEQREGWLLAVKSLAKNRNLKSLTRQMEEMGQGVNYATIRLWLNFGSDVDANIPNTQARFLAFAKAAEIELPVEVLKLMFQGIKRLRVGHRLAGRQLARAIRAAYLDRLDAGSQERLKREWGMDAFQLMQSARVAVVDDVFLPRGYSNAIDGYGL